MGVVVEEGDESGYWIELLAAAGKTDRRTAMLLQEGADHLVAGVLKEPAECDASLANEECQLASLLPFFTAWSVFPLRPAPDKNMVGNRVPGVVNSDEEEQQSRRPQEEERWACVGVSRAGRYGER